MHALLAHAYHLALLAIHLALRPVWRPLGACLAVAALGRVLGLPARRNAAVLAGGAVLIGWLMQVPPVGWPLPPVARLSGLALVMLAVSVFRNRSRRGWAATLVGPILAGWWLRGAPLSTSGLVWCAPVIEGLVVALPVAAWAARRDRGQATALAGFLLAAALWVVGAAPHWAWAACVPAVAALALLGLPQAMPALAGMLVMVAAACLVASDRGRLLRVDLACCAPLLVLLLARLRGSAHPS